ncbi:MAG: hypothetical protein LBC40_05700 [Dysgonamonadaceae bacterium]|jgi:hypothetical protein|nr:hypothetical protein [Dysgonamonadaceae bacterium]
MAKNEIFDFGTTAYLPGAKAIVVASDSSGIVNDSKGSVMATPVNRKESIRFVAWGEGNDLPVRVMNSIYKNISVSSNVDFNARIAYGDSVIVCRKKRNVKGEIVFEEMLPSEAPEVFKFLEDNNMNRVHQELGNDMAVFYDGFVEFIFNKDVKSPKIVMLRQKEAVFSRLSEQDEDSGRIEWHGYSAKWTEGYPDDLVVTPFLDRDAPIYDLKKRKGIYPDEKTGKQRDCGDKRFVMSVALPTPGRFYYSKPYWWSIFESGWYDFACAIPKFKKALLRNQMVLKYHVQINSRFWDKLYKAEGILEPKKRAARKIKFLNELNDFLSGGENAGKSFVSHFQYDMQKGIEEQDVIIKPLESFFKGGEYIEDSEEASNAICYAMGVHPSLQGASPGKGKSINGTEARELFIIKQALTKPIRDMLLLPLYAVKAINGWDPDIHFVIPNIMLTTLDKNTGAEKQIGNQKI